MGIFDGNGTGRTTIANIAATSGSDGKENAPARSGAPGHVAHRNQVYERNIGEIITDSTKASKGSKIRLKSSAVTK